MILLPLKIVFYLIFFKRAIVKFRALFGCILLGFFDFVKFLSEWHSKLESQGCHVQLCLLAPPL